MGLPHLGHDLSDGLTELPHSLQISLFSTGQPQLGQVEALSETSCPHSLHFISAITINNLRNRHTSFHPYKL